MLGFVAVEVVGQRAEAGGETIGHGLRWEGGRQCLRARWHRTPTLEQKGSISRMHRPSINNANLAVLVGTQREVQRAGGQGRREGGGLTFNRPSFQDQVKRRPSPARSCRNLRDRKGVSARSSWLVSQLHLRNHELGNARRC
jgi:hypothetical protein